MEIEGYENYLIYPDGKVYSKVSKRYLLAQLNKSGYLHIGLYKDNKRKEHKIHRLVGLHYITNPDNKPFLDHINRDKLDNRVENLRWVTRSENGQNVDKRKHNKSGIKNIYYDKTNRGYRYEKQINSITHRKRFKTLEEAIEYKKNIENI